MPFSGDQLFLPLEGARGHRILDYRLGLRGRAATPAPPWKRFPSVMAGWDNTARRPYARHHLRGLHARGLRALARLAADSVSTVRPEENYLFIVAWNEWAEGNHLEPDQRYGRAFLDATRAVLLGSGPPASFGPVSSARRAPTGTWPPRRPTTTSIPTSTTVPSGTPPDWSAPCVDGPELQSGRPRGGHGGGQPRAAPGRLAYHGLELHPVAVDLMKRPASRPPSATSPTSTWCRPRSTTSVTSGPSCSSTSSST